MAERRVENSHVHAQLSKFTSGSHPSSSHPGILGCLSAGARKGQMGLTRAGKQPI